MKNTEKAAYNGPDTKINAKQHAKLLSDVLSLNKRSQLKKATRTEPTTQISEFNLVKSVRGNKGAVRISELTKVLKKRAKHVEIGKKIKSAGRKAKTLSKPLEKPKAQRIRRTVAFENVKKQLGRWDAVVTSNRASNHLSFPLPADTKLESSKNFTGFRLKTDLQKKLEELEPKVEVFSLEKEPEYPLTMKEMLEHRKEMAKMRAVQSYKEAKARRQSKIKSKKYHRVQRQEKIKKQMKEFEQLQKTSPVEALKKLEEIERVRAEERASLRHRSTGKWAQSKQVRAKYDKESRQVLAQQLQISRELTQKVKANYQDSESDEEPANSKVVSKSSENNPWTNPIKTSGEVETFLSGYRKFWESENKKTADDNQISDVTDADKLPENDSSVEITDTLEKEESKPTVTVPDQNHNEEELKQVENQAKHSQKLLNENHSEKLSKRKKKKNQNSPENTTSKQQPKSRIKENQTKKKFIGTTNWDVSVLSDDNDEEIDAIFDNFDDKIKKRLKNKYAKIKKELQKQKIRKQKIMKQQNKQQHKTVKKSKPKKQRNEVDLSFPQSATRPVIDEELLENVQDGERTENSNKSLAIIDSILKTGSIANEESSTDTKITNNVDPNNIIKIESVNLNTEIPDLLTLEDNEENTDQRGTISEAFQDDDILDEFQKDKRAEIQGEKPKDINSALPGWGSWGGTGIKPSKRRQRRFIIRFPKKFKRRDQNKGHLIINEKANAKIKPHLVSEIPFPFKSVKDFEATVRAPIGNTFVPETAFRKMIRPAVTTKMGTIIEPMTDDVLLKKKK